MDRSTRRDFVWMTISAALITGCAKKKTVAVTPPALKTRPAQPGQPQPAPEATPPAPAAGATERGLASWYGHPYHGRPAADGEIYDMEKLVAAHRTLPFQTIVRVRNLANGKTVDVRIIDRGPFVNGRIIDLSHAAAKEIDLIGPGVATVELTIVGAPSTSEPALFAVQVGAFREKVNADRAQQNMTAAYGSAKAVLRSGEPPLWRILAGRETSPEAAEALARRIRADQREPQAFVVRLDP